MNPQIFFATIALAIGSFMNVLDMTIVNVSLSHIAGDFAVTPNQGTWVITSYSVAEAIFLPLIGWLTLKFGTIKQYIWATILFTIASMLCGISPTFEFLLVMRVLQGVVGASMIPLSQTLMLKLYPKEKKGIALGIWSMTIVVAPVIGPILGGWITDVSSWRWCFYINLPFGILSTLIVYYIFKDKIKEEKTQKEPVDFVGLIFLIIGVASLQLMLDKGNELDWFSNWVTILLAILAFVFIGLLIIWEWHHERPLVNVKFFSDRNFTVGSFALMVGIMAYFSTVVIIPMWLQNFMGYTSYISGKSTATVGISVMMVAIILGKKIDRIDARIAAAVGFALLGGVSLFTSNFSPEITPGYVQFTRFLNGFGVGMFFISLNTLTLSNVPENSLAAASGIYNFMRNIGSSIGTSLIAPLWNRTMAIHHAEIANGITATNPQINLEMAQSPAYIGGIYKEVILQSAIMGVNDILKLGGILILLVIPFIFLANSTKGKSVPVGH